MNGFPCKHDNVGRFGQFLASLCGTASINASRPSSTVSRPPRGGCGRIKIIVALNIEAVAEALLFAAKAGADPAKVRQALIGGFASSRVLEAHGERMVKRTFTPGFRLELHQKDLNVALSNARELGVSLPNTATAQQLFNACAAHGGSGWDHSALVRALEKLADFTIGQPPQR